MTVVNINKKKWEKTTPYGDYTKTPDRINSRTNKVTHIIREARALNVAGKHVGSKPIKKLLQAIARAHEAIAMTKEETLKDEKIKEGDEEI